MSQPNFLQIRTSLVRAIALAEQTPALRSSAAYGARMAQALHRFDYATRETDRTYSEWRLLLGAELKAFREARRDWDQVIALCDEHAIDGVPSRRIAYTERDLVMELMADTAAFLDGCGESWEWIPVWSARLRGHIETANAARKQSEDRYLEYTEFVKSRIMAFEEARNLVSEYVRDAAADHRTGDALTHVRFDVL